MDENNEALNRKAEEELNKIMSQEGIEDRFKKFNKKI